MPKYAGHQNIFFKAVWCSVLPSRGLNANKQYKIYVVFGVSRTVGNTEHRTFYKKMVLLIAVLCFWYCYQKYHFWYELFSLKNAVKLSRTIFKLMLKVKVCSVLPGSTVFVY